MITLIMILFCISLIGLFALSVIDAWTRDECETIYLKVGEDENGNAVYEEICKVYDNY